MSLEKIVRPFESPTFAPRVLQPEPASPVSSEEGVLTFEGGSDGKFNEGDPFIFTGFKTDDTFNETKSSRVTESVKVTNPEDDSQYVEVERMMATAFKNKRTGDSMNLNFASWNT